MTETELENLIFDTAKFHLNYGKGSWEELKNPYCGTDEENEHQTTIWATVRRNVEDEWIHELGFPENLSDAFWWSVESCLKNYLKVTTDYPEIDTALLDWINA